MRIVHSLSALALFFTGAAAHADTLQTFALNGTVLFGTVHGTVELDLDADLTTGKGLFDSTADFAYTNGGQSTLFSGRNNGYGVSNNAATFLLFLGQGNSIFELDLPINTGVLAGYSGGPICAVFNFNCNGLVSYAEFANGGFSALQSGSLAPSTTPTVTPEPSSFALLGTGLVGLFTLVRRRFE